MQLISAAAAALFQTAAALACLKGIRRYDAESGLRIGKREACILSAASFLLNAMAVQPFTGIAFLQVWLLFTYLLIMAYTDSQTGYVYTVFSVLLLLLEGGVFVTGLMLGQPGWESLRADILYTAVFLSGCLGAAGWRLLGMGDVLVFTVLALFYLNQFQDSAAVLLFTVMLAHVLFLLGNLPKYFRLEKHERIQPFTLSIAAAACITVMVFA